jgi:hypothetical protein
MATLLSLLTYGLGAFLALLVLDLCFPTILRILRPILPKDTCGPDGWLLDPERGHGIFDRRK